MENEWFPGVRYFVSAIKRIFLSTKYLIHVVLTLLLSFFSLRILEMVNQVSEVMPSEMMDAFRTGGMYNIGILSVSRLNVIDGPFYDEMLLGVLSGSFMQCILAVLVSTFICSEYKNGYVGLAIMHGQKRMSIFNQYILVSSILIIPLIITSVVGTLISLSVHNMVSFSNANQIIGILLIQTFMLIAVGISITSFSIMVGNNKAIGVSVGGIFILPLIPSYIRVFTNGKVNIDRFLLLNQLIISGNSDEINITQYVLVALTTSMFFYIVGLTVFKYRNFE